MTDHSSENEPGGAQGQDVAKTKAPPPAAKRFYTKVAVAPCENGYKILLDERQLRTPARQILSVPSRPLADAIGEEWDAQKETINPETMPLTRLCNTVIDGVVANRDAVVADIASYAAHDAICYRAEGPAKLAARQSETWDPIIDWAQDQFGVRWVCAVGVMPVEQPHDATRSVSQKLETFDPFTLAALHELTALSGSSLLAIARQAGVLSFDAFWQAANIDEDWQIEQWGTDDEAQAQRKDRTEQARSADRLLHLLNAA